MKRMAANTALITTVNIRSSLAFLLALVWIIGCVTGCETLRRSPGSGYANRFDDLTDYEARRDRKALVHEQVVDEMGYGGRELSETQKYALRLRVQLRDEEKLLSSRKEKEQYYRYKPLLRDDRERLELLRIGNYEGRERWLNAKGISSKAVKHTTEVQQLIEANDIAVGMSKYAVKDSWGDPQSVEVAGNPLYGNERWKYEEHLASPEGYQTETRYVYFESGRVIGWEKYDDQTQE